MRHTAAKIILSRYVEVAEAARDPAVQLDDALIASVPPLLARLVLKWARSCLDVSGMPNPRIALGEHSAK